MNVAKAKTKNHVDHDAVRPDPWQPGHPAIEAAGDLEPAVDLSLRSFRNEAEIHAISSALRQMGWNRKRAAKLLGISYRCLLYKIRQHNITPTVERG